VSGFEMSSEHLQSLGLVRPERRHLGKWSDHGDANTIAVGSCNEEEVLAIVDVGDVVGELLRVVTTGCRGCAGASGPDLLPKHFGRSGLEGSQMPLRKVRRARAHVDASQLDWATIGRESVVHARDSEPLIEDRQTAFQHGR
jgi:hypothetical protein